MGTLLRNGLCVALLLALSISAAVMVGCATPSTGASTDASYHAPMSQPIPSTFNSPPPTITYMHSPNMNSGAFNAGHMR
jgi:hypothetical protein